jgi:hypothetical protein
MKFRFFQGCFNPLYQKRVIIWEVSFTRSKDDRDNLGHSKFKIITFVLIGKVLIAGGVSFSVRVMSYCFPLVLACEFGFAVFRLLQSSRIVSLQWLPDANVCILNEVMSCMYLSEGASYYYHGQKEHYAHFLRLHDRISHIIHWFGSSMRKILVSTLNALWNRSSQCR